MRDVARVLDGGDRHLSFPRNLFVRQRSARYSINVLLALVAVGLEIYYTYCGGSCSYLRGNLVGIPLQYVGLAFMACVILLNLFKRDTLLLALLSAGVGVEAYLVGFQTWHKTYCLYCLAFGGIVLILFLLNFTSAKKWLAAVFMALALILFPLFFEGSLTPSYAEEIPSVPAFGHGKVGVRLYTDYFCPPCRAIEPDIEPIILDLVKRKKVSVMFIDVPFHDHSTLYAKYYLYAMEGKSEIQSAYAVREVLNEAAERNVDDPLQVEALLTKKGIAIKPFDPKPIFDLYTRALTDDRIRSTPACVVEYHDGRKEKATGKADIMKVLKALR